MGWKPEGPRPLAGSVHDSPTGFSRTRPKPRLGVGVFSKRRDVFQIALFRLSSAAFSLQWARAVSRFPESHEYSHGTIRTERVRTSQRRYLPRSAGGQSICSNLRKRTELGRGRAVRVSRSARPR